MKYYILIYTDNIKEGFGGMANAFTIRIRPKYKNDIGLLEHEKVHVKQFWRTLGIYCILYPLSKEYRLKSEVEAYRKQLEFCEDKKYSRMLFADNISTKYKLDITKVRAYDYLL